MPPTHWLPSRRRPVQQPPAASTSPDNQAAPEPPAPDGFWLTDPGFLTRLREATLTMLHLVENVMDDDFTVVEALDGARHHAIGMLGIPAEYAALVEAEAAARIVETADLPTGSPFGPVTARGLARIDQMPAEDQQHLVHAAARRYAALTRPSRRPEPAPATAPTPPHPPAPRRSH